MVEKAPEVKKPLTLDGIYGPENRIPFAGTPRSFSWTSDGKHIIQRLTDAGESPNVPMRIAVESGQAVPLYDLDGLVDSLAAAGVPEDDARKVCRAGAVTLNSDGSAALINVANRLFLYDAARQGITKVTEGSDPPSGEEFSPNDRYVGFVKGSNLFVADASAQREVQLTTDGTAEILNGRLNWVYQEEIYGRGNFKGYWWSPDSERIAFLQLDQSGMKDYTIIDDIPVRQVLEVAKYPLAGGPNPGVRLGVVDIRGTAATWLDLSRYAGQEILLVRVLWRPDGKRLAFQVQNREQTFLDLLLGDPETGEVDHLLRETSEAWVSVEREMRFLKDGSFVWSSERTGWKHLYHMSAEGNLIQPITNGDWEARTLRAVDEAGGTVYFSGTPDSPIEDHTYRVQLDGTGLKRLDPDAGNHQTEFNVGVTHFVRTRSDVVTPPATTLHRIDGTVERVLSDDTVHPLEDYQSGSLTFHQVPNREGFLMEAFMIRPSQLEPGRRYPVVCFTYGGPHAQQVRNIWGGANLLWHRLLAERGYIVWVIDNQTASGKGFVSTSKVYRNFGVSELRDIEDGLDWLKAKDFVDDARVGIWGSSYGGYMTLYAMTHCERFKAGIAVAPVTDYRLYDSIYTERYLLTPEHNPDGYAQSAPLHQADNLHGRLLLIHGTMDDNVHMQNSIQMAYALQKAGKRFDFMLYPKRRHGAGEPFQEKHMRQLMLDFIERYV